MANVQSHEWEHEAHVSSRRFPSAFYEAPSLVRPTQTQAEPSGAQATTVMRGMQAIPDARIEETPSIQRVKTRGFDTNASPASLPSWTVVTTAAVSQASADSFPGLSDEDAYSNESQGFLSSLWLCLRKDPQQVFALVGGMVVLIQRHIRRGQVFPLDHCRVAEVVEYGKFIVLPPEEFLSTAHEELVTEANLLFVVRLLECWLPEIECSQLSKCEIEELISEPSQLLRCGHRNGLQELVGITRRGMRCLPVH